MRKRQFFHVAYKKQSLMTCKIWVVFFKLCLITYPLRRGISESLLDVKFFSDWEVRNVG